METLAVAALVGAKIRPQALGAAGMTTLAVLVLARAIVLPPGICMTSEVPIEMLQLSKLLRLEKVSTSSTVSSSLFLTNLTIPNSRVG